MPTKGTKLTAAQKRARKATMTRNKNKAARAKAGGRKTSSRRKG